MKLSHISLSAFLISCHCLDHHVHANNHIPPPPPRPPPPSPLIHQKGIGAGSRNGAGNDEQNGYAVPRPPPPAAPPLDSDFDTRGRRGRSSSDVDIYNRSAIEPVVGEHMSNDSIDDHADAHDNINMNNHNKDNHTNLSANHNGNGNTAMKNVHNKHIDEDDDAYSEQIMTRQEAELFIKNFDTSQKYIPKRSAANTRTTSTVTTASDNVPPPPQPPSLINSQTLVNQEKEVHVPVPVVAQQVNHHSDTHGNGPVRDNCASAATTFGTNAPSNHQIMDMDMDTLGNQNIIRPSGIADDFQPSQQEEEWIVPKHMQFQPQHQPQQKQHQYQPQHQPQQPDTIQRLHQPPPLAHIPQPDSRGYGHGNAQQYNAQLRGPMPRTYPQRPIPSHQQPPHEMAPRNYNYNRTPSTQPIQQHHSQSQNQSQLQPYRGQPPQPGSGALVPHRQHPAPTQKRPIAQSLLERFGRSIDAFSDVDTAIASKAQHLLQTVSASSDTIAGSVSGAMRKTVFSSLDSVTGLKENIKDRVRGNLGSLFGGAPTLATETKDQWEDDRRRTVTENRRKAILGDCNSQGSGETFVGSSGGESPLQQHLFGLANELEGHGDDVKGQGPGGTREGWDGQGADQDLNGMGDQENFDQRKQVASNDSQPTEADNIKSIPQLGENPYAMLAYPASEILDEDDSSDIEDYEDAVDPSTFFGSSSSSQDRPRQSSPASFEFEDEPRSVGQKIGGLFKIPSFKIPRFRRSSLKGFDDSVWSDDEWGASSTSKPKRMAPPRSNAAPQSQFVVSTKGETASSVDDLLDRFSTSSTVSKKATTNLLSKSDIRELRHIGRSKALIDMMAITFLYIIIQECLRAFSGTFGMLRFPLPKNIDDIKMIARQISSAINISDVRLSQTWAPFALIAFILSVCSGDVFVQPAVERTTEALSKTIESSIIQSQLFLRVVSGIPLRHDLVQNFAMAVKGQSMASVEITRLRVFLLLTALAISAASIAVVQPICTSICVAVIDLFLYEGLREWPIEWNALGEVVKGLAISHSQRIWTLVKDEMDTLISNPMAIISTTSVVAALFIFSQLSTLERSRSTTAAREGSIAYNAKKDQEIKVKERLANIGVSSASRIGLQMQEHGVDRALSQMQSVAHVLSSKSAQFAPPATSLAIRKLIYRIICGALALAPLFGHIFISFLNDKAIDVGNFCGIALVLLFAYNLAMKSLFTTIDSSRYLSQIAPFLKVLSNTVQEVEASNIQSSRMTQVSSPSKGIVISDLWAAHKSKRSWACRGINVSCKPGEVVLILGEESSGKTKLLTVIGETLASPPNLSKTTTLARGNISVGGVDAQKWNSPELKGKIGIMLNDVRTLSDMSQLHSGMSLEDVLTPTCSRRMQSGAIESAISIATQFTGLSSIVSRLPLELKTIVTANEDELGPSNPTTVALSATEWSKVMLTKVISQALVSNDNSMAANSISKSLIGSILLFDDVASHFSETAEKKLIKSLKSSGAATLMTSKRWAIGRFATRILVMKDGSVVESGTHTELISRGKDSSIYAGHWAEMMSG